MPTNEETPDPLPQPTPDTEEWRAYRLGMWRFGTGLIAAGVIQLLAAGALFAISGIVPLILVVLAGSGGVHLIAGILLRRGKHWVNTALAYWGMVLMVACVVSFRFLNMSPTSQGVWFYCFILPGAIVVYALQNLYLYRRAVASSARGG